MVNMGELFAYRRLQDVAMDLVPLSEAERQFLLEPGDLLFARQSLVLSGAGQCSIFLGNSKPTVFESHIIRCRLNHQVADPRFYFYFFRSPAGSTCIEQIVEQGAGASGIRGSDLALVKVPKVPIEKQREVAAILSALDDRIDNLRQTNEILEAVAQALFKSWFVDFDPVRAKAEGREPDGMDAATAALFPSEFEESELGPIPKGWRVGGSNELLEIVGGGTPKTSVDEFWGGDIPWFSVVDAPASGQVFTLDTTKKITEAGLANCSAKLLPPLTTIISARGTVGKVAMTGVPMAMNQSCYALRPKAAGGEAFIYFSTLRFVERLQRIAHGAVFDTITRDSFKQVMTCLPSDGAVAAFNSFAEPLLQRIRANGFQAASLAGLRDALLPRLISGKLRLPEAAAHAEDALA
jgi:type I restriction enzyme S subunit